MWSRSHLVWSKSDGGRSQLWWWALNQMAYLQEFSPVISRGSQVAQM